MKIRAVLFDLDGVLIDSPPVHAWAWAEIFRPLGIELPPERLHREEGRKSEAIAEGILREYGLTIHPDALKEMLNRKRRMYRNAAPKGLRRDSRAAVEALLSRRIKVGLVSGSAMENVRGILTSEELALFDVLITAESYNNGKPDPEPYLLGCRSLEVEPDDAAAVENAPLGVLSAKAAGLLVVGVATTLPAEELVGVDLILPDLRGLVEALEVYLD